MITNNKKRGKKFVCFVVLSIMKKFFIKITPVLFVLLSFFFIFFTIIELLDAYKENGRFKMMQQGILFLAGTIYIILRFVRYRKERQKEEVNQ
jgi:hypothetical protein